MFLLGSRNAPNQACPSRFGFFIRVLRPCLTEEEMAIWGELTITDKLGRLLGAGWLVYFFLLDVEFTSFFLTDFGIFSFLFSRFSSFTACLWAYNSS